MIPLDVVSRQIVMLMRLMSRSDKIMDYRLNALSPILREAAVQIRSLIGCGNRLRPYIYVYKPEYTACIECGLQNTMKYRLPNKLILVMLIYRRCIAATDMYKI